MNIIVSTILDLFKALTAPFLALAEDDSGPLIFLKASLSQSVNSKSTSVKPDAQLTGLRFLLITSYKGVSRFTYHLQFKRRMHEGSTKLSVNRFGADIGFVIF